MTSRDFSCDALSTAYSKLLNTLDEPGKKFAQEKPIYLIDGTPHSKEIYRWRNIDGVIFYRTYDQIHEKRGWRQKGIRTPDQKIYVDGLWNECNRKK